MLELGAELAEAKCPAFMIEVEFESGREAGKEELVEWFKYKKVANRTKPVSTMLPEEYRIVRKRHPDPLGDLPPLPYQLGEFVPGWRYTQERYDEMDIDPEGFLWPEEKKLAHEVVRLNEMGLAWDESVICCGLP